MAKQLSEKKQNELKEAFYIAEGQSKGENKINMPQVGNVMRSIGLCPTQAQLNAIAQETGANVNGTDGKLFNLEECRRIVQKNAHLVETKESILECFRIFDKDGNGYVSAAEVRHVLTSLGENLRDEEVDELLREVNLTVDGQFAYDDVAGLLMDPM